MPQFARAALVVFLAFTAMVPVARACSDGCDEPAPVVSGVAVAEVVGEAAPHGEDCTGGDCDQGCITCPCCVVLSVVTSPRMTVAAPAPSALAVRQARASSPEQREIGDIFQPPRA